MPVHSFEPDLTGIGILMASGSGYNVLRHLRYEQDAPTFLKALLGVLREIRPFDLRASG